MPWDTQALQVNADLSFRWSRGKHPIQPGRVSKFVLANHTMPQAWWRTAECVEEDDSIDQAVQVRARYRQAAINVVESSDRASSLETGWQSPRPRSTCLPA